MGTNKNEIKYNTDEKEACPTVGEQEASPISTRKRDYSFAGNNHQNGKCVKAIYLTTQEVSYYRSLYGTQQHLSINAGIIKMICDGISYCKTGISKRNGQRYRFEYMLPTEVSVPGVMSSICTWGDEHKVWRTRKYICPRCNRTITNGGKSKHNNTCN